MSQKDNWLFEASDERAEFNIWRGTTMKNGYQRGNMRHLYETSKSTQKGMGYGARCFAKPALLFCAFMGLTATAFAGLDEGELDGMYIPKRGWAETQEIAKPNDVTGSRQLGVFRIVLEREGWNELSSADQTRIRRNLLIKGTMLGEFNATTMSVDHTLSNEERDGLLYTENDQLTPTSGDPFCSTGTPLEGVETMHLVQGLGLYQNLVEGTLMVRGTVNNCPDSPGYRRNTFDVVGDSGGLLFRIPQPETISAPAPHAAPPYWW